MTIRWTYALAFMFPALALYFVFSLYPLFSGVVLSFTEFDGSGQAIPNGLDNYVRMFSDPAVLGALRNTAVYAVTVVVIQNALGLGLAAVLASLPDIRNGLRVLLLTPSMFSAVIAAYVWTYLYSPLDGGLNAFLKLIGLGSLQATWLGDPALALFALAAVHIWMFAGYSCAIYLASYLAISTDLLDAAALDGATGWRRFRYIEWPLLAPATTVAVTLSTIGTLRAFELPLVMTGGGPVGSTTTFGLLLFKQAFSKYEFGYGSALAVVLMLIVIVISAVQAGYLKSRETRI